MSRAYLRVQPAMFERKVIQQHYPPLAFAAFAATLCLADSQPIRGRFRDERVLRALLGPLSRQVPFLMERGDVVPASGHNCANCPDGHAINGQLYVDGWDEWQEGDWQVKERLARVKAKGRTNGYGPDRSESHGADRSASALAGRGEAESEAGRGNPGRKTTNPLSAFEHHNGKAPDAKEADWIGDLSRDFGREVVAKAILNDEGAARGLLSRVSQSLRHA